MTALRALLLLLVLMAAGCERVPFCDAFAQAEQCAVADESTEGDGDGDGDGDSDGEFGDGDGDGEPGDGDGEQSDPIVYPDDPPEAYARVDRKGMPAVATAVIMNKDEYNTADPVDDAMGAFVNEMNGTMLALHDTLNDDLTGFGFEPCIVVDCYAQAAPLIIPDTLKLDIDQPAGFPNGRALPDPVIDITLAVILLDLTVMGQTAGAFAAIPLNPAMNDVPYDAEFPYLAAPN